MITRHGGHRCRMQRGRGRIDQVAHVGVGDAKAAATFGAYHRT
jgi:hypothetical protein